MERWVAPRMRQALVKRICLEPRGVNQRLGLGAAQVAAAIYERVDQLHKPTRDKGWSASGCCLSKKGFS